MAARLTVLPDEAFVSLRERLRERVRDAADAVGPDNFGHVLDPVMRGVLAAAFDEIVASEGTVWLVDRAQEVLVPAFNTGPNAATLVNTFRQPLTQGLISMVFRNGQPFCENQVYLNESQDRTLDTSLSMLTCAMIAVPLDFAHSARGVISCVKLKPAASSEPDPPGFSPDDLHRIQRAASVLSRLLDFFLVGSSVGWLRR